MTSEDVFFAEWRARPAGSRRSLDRARLLLARLGSPVPPPVLSVVGSKGKGTAAIHASAYLAAAGLRVVTVTSPALRSNRERIRLDGAAVADLGPLAERLGRHVPVPEPLPGYLSPAGLFTIAGVLYACEVAADALVLEAGMGGGSDEISLFPPVVTAITEIFGEHLGVLGDTPVEIAREKAAVTARSTRAVVSLPQRPEIADAIARTVRERAGVAVELLSSPPMVYAEASPWPYGRRNAALGRAAAARLLDVLGRARPAAEALRPVLDSVTLPGRLSRHALPSGTELLIDSAINRDGIATALAAARTVWPRVDHVLLCLPDHKDLTGAIAELDGLPVTFVRLGLSHLRFERPLPGHWRSISEEELSVPAIRSLGEHVLALGTVYFTGRLLDLLDVPTERLFTVPRAVPSGSVAELPHPEVPRGSNQV